MAGSSDTVRPVARRDTRPLQSEIGRRIDEAWKAAGYAARADMIRATGLPDANQVHVWARGAALPRIDGLIAIAEVCGVSLDWLCRGAEETPAAYLEWLDAPDGVAASEEARRFLRSLPVHGYRATVAFYELAHAAWRHGLHREVSPEEMVAHARAHERHGRSSDGGR